MQSKKLLLATVTALCIGNTMADQKVFNNNNITVALGGALNAAIGFRAGNRDAHSLAPNNKHLATDTSAAVHASVSLPKFHGWNYGAQVGISTTKTNDDPAGSDFFERSYIYAENPDVGRIEVGTRNGASRAMRIHGGSVAVAYGGIDGGWGNFISIDNSAKTISDSNFIDGPGLAISEGSHEHGKIEKYRKITFYTPLMDGFKLGLSYGPDASNTGNRSRLPLAPSQTPADSGAIIKDRAADIFAGGMSWEKKFGIQEVKFAVVGEYARYNSVVYTDEKWSAYNPYKAVMVGGQYTYDDISIAASYGNLFDSKLPKSVKLSGGSHVSTVGISYDFGTGATSLGYLYSTKNKNTFHLASAGVEYRLAPGIVPYAEVTYFHAHQKRKYNGPLKPIKDSDGKITGYEFVQPSIDLSNVKNSGTAIVIGTRIAF